MRMNVRERGRRAVTLLVGASIVVAAAGVASAQTIQISVPYNVVVPGASVTATVTGPPGQFFAVTGSATNAGFSYGGVPLPMGPDVIVLHVGVLDGTGQATVPVTPPFIGTVLDRYYLMAAWSTNSSFLPPNPSSSIVVRNGDLVGSVVGPPGPVGPQGPVGPTGPTGPIGLTGAAGPVGPMGSTGAVGPQGLQGPPGVSGFEHIAGETSLPDDSPGKIAHAECPPGKVLIGGGYAISESSDIIVTRINGPQDNGQVWTVIAHRVTGSGVWTLGAFALCAWGAP